MNDASFGSVCVIGAGLAGLSAAYDLGRAGVDVTVLEAAPDLGGLASSLQIGGTPIERFYHFICRADSDLIDLVDELGLSDQLHWTPSKTSFFHDGRLYGFSSPLDLLRFSPVPIDQRIRFGLNVTLSRYRREWRTLDGLAARDWLIRQIGRRAYDVIWDPLLRIKFGDAHHTVSAAWIWHRINRIATSRRHLWEKEHLGYLENGSATVIDALAQRLQALPTVSLRTGSPVERIEAKDQKVSSLVLKNGEELRCRSIISTLALSPFLRLVPNIEESYRSRLESIEYLGTVCGLLSLRESVTDSFWVNVNDSAIPFNGIIEYTNLNTSPRFNGRTMLYVPHYLQTSHPRFSASDEELLDEFCAGISRINPAFDRSWIEECHISRAAHAQAICTVGFTSKVPEHRTPIGGLFLTDSAQFYPEDRTISAAIRLGRTASSHVLAWIGHDCPA